MNNDKKDDYFGQIADVVINHLLANGINDQRALNLIAKFPRSQFLPDDYKILANSDGAVFYKKDRYIIETSTMAMMLSLIEKDKLSNVLVIGSGFGYSVALLSQISDHVTGVEADSNIMEEATKIIADLNISNINFENTNLLNLDIATKFDLILVEGALADIPKAWLDMLEENGVLLGIKRSKNISKLVKVLACEGEFIWNQDLDQQVPTPYLVNPETKDRFEF